MKWYSISALSSFYWRRVSFSAKVPARSLGVFRLLLGVYLLVFGIIQVGWIDAVPRAFFDPPILSIPRLVGGFPPSPILRILDIGTWVTLAVVTVGLYTRLATCALFGFLVAGSSFHYSFGKVDHGTLLLIALLACMVVADWGRYYSLDSLRPRDGDDQLDSERRAARGLSVFATIVAFGFFTASLPKLKGWVDLDLATSGVKQWLTPSQVSLDRSGLLSGVVPRLPEWGLEILDYSAVVLELSGFVVLLTGRRAWQAFLFVLALFHLCNVLVFNITFSTQTWVYLVFVDFTSVAAAIRLERFLKWLCVVIAGVAAYRILTLVSGFGSKIVFIPDATVPDAAMWQAIATCSLVCGVLAWSYWSCYRQRLRRVDIVGGGGRESCR